MMVDLDDDSEWSIKDTIEDEEDDRLILFLFLFIYQYYSMNILQ